MNRLLRLSVVSVWVAILFIPSLSSPNASADNLILYTDYYQYDNNETLDFHLIGTNNTTYMLTIWHRESDSPLTMIWYRTDENNTTIDGHIGLYEIDEFGTMELRADNESYNQSATTEFRLVPSQAWWEGEVDDIITDANRREGRYLSIVFALSMTIVVFLGVFVLRYREMMKEARGELSIGDRLLIAKPWDYDTYADDIAEDHPQAQSERAHLKFKNAWWRLLDILKMKRELRDYEQLLKEEKELKAKLPNLLKDLISEKEAAGILKEGQWDGMSAEERYAFLHPGEKKEPLSD